MGRSLSLLFLDVVLLWSVVNGACCMGRSSDHNLLQAQATETKGEGHGGQSASEPRAYAQWAAYFIRYSGSGSLVVANASLDWGKWYDYPDKDKEISSPNGVTASTSELGIVAACGRQYSPSGTEGSFTLWSGSQRVLLIRFDCPWAGSNSQSVVRYGTNFFIEVDSAPNSGPIGIINVNIIPRTSTDNTTRRAVSMA